MCFTFMGRFAYFATWPRSFETVRNATRARLLDMLRSQQAKVFGAEVLLWRWGHAKCTFPETWLKISLST